MTLGVAAAGTAAALLAPTPAAAAVDGTAPTVAPAGVMPDYANAATTFLYFHVADDLSGLASVSAAWGRTSVPLVNNAIDARRLVEGRRVLSIVATDNAGNTALYSKRFTVDRTGPVLTRTTYRVTRPFAIVTGVDFNSGPRRAIYRVGAGGFGTSRHSLTLRDRAGNRRRVQFVIDRHISLSRGARNRGAVLIDEEGRPFRVTDKAIACALRYTGPSSMPYPHTVQSPSIVREIQWRLKLRRYLPQAYPLTGIIDIETMRAIKRLQRDFALPAISTAGPRTRRRLDALFPQQR